MTRIVFLPPLFLPPESYFKAMAEADLAVIDTSMRYDKRFKAVHRTVVSGSAGPAFLTVPVSTSTSRCTWTDVNVSAHGQWYRVMQLTLATLFAPTPYYNYYRHDLLAALGPQAVGRPVTDLDIDLILAVRRLCDITTPLSVVLDPRCADDADTDIVDMRRHDFYADPEVRSVVETLFIHGRL